MTMRDFECLGGPADGATHWLPDGWGELHVCLDSGVTHIYLLKAEDDGQYLVYTGPSRIAHKVSSTA